MPPIGFLLSFFIYPQELSTFYYLLLRFSFILTTFTLSLGGLTGATLIYASNRCATSAKTDVRGLGNNKHNLFHSFRDTERGKGAVSTGWLRIIKYMIEVKDLFSKYEFKEIKSRKTEWGEHVQYFHDRVNKERGKYKPLSMARVASYLAPFKDDIYFFTKRCDSAKSFSACFWYHVKPKKNVQKNNTPSVR